METYEETNDTDITKETYKKCVKRNGFSLRIVAKTIVAILIVAAVVFVAYYIGYDHGLEAGKPWYSIF